MSNRRKATAPRTPTRLPAPPKVHRTHAEMVEDIRRGNIRALMACTGNSDTCRESIHVPGCMVGR